METDVLKPIHNGLRTIGSIEELQGSQGMYRHYPDGAGGGR